MLHPLLLILNIKMHKYSYVINVYMFYEHFMYGINKHFTKAIR